MDNKIEIEPVVVGEPIVITVTFHDEREADTFLSGKTDLSANVIARYRTLVRHQIKTELKKHPAKANCYTGKVGTACGTGLQADIGEEILRVRANDTVTVKIEGGLEVQAVASGVNADDFLIGRSIEVNVLDMAAAKQDIQHVEVEATIVDPDKEPIQKKKVKCALQREEGESNQFNGFIDTTSPAGDMGAPDNALIVKDRNKVVFEYKRSDGKELRWHVHASDTNKVNLQVTGGISPGKPIEVMVADSDKANLAAVKIIILNHRTGKVVEKGLERVEGFPWKFKGIVHTASKPIEGWATVQAGDPLEVFYLDEKKAFHRESVEILEPRETINDLPWQKKYCRRAFFMPSLKPLLAELNCLEVRLHYYRSTASSIYESHRADLIERSLQRANRSLSDNKWDLTTAWEALHDAKRQEVYLLGETEAEGEMHQILADTKELISKEHRNSIKELIDKSKTAHQRDWASDRWRGYIVSAMEIFHEQQDTYYIRQNMVRDRMLLMTFFLALFLFVFFTIQWNSNVADALVNSRTIKEIFTLRSPLAYGLGDVADDKTTEIRFIGETVIGQPLVLAVFDRGAENQNSITAELRCTDETASLCPNWQDQYSLKKVPGRKGWYRFVIETGEGEPKKGNPGVLVFKPGAEVVANYTRAEKDANVDPSPVETTRTRMLDASWFPTINLGSGWIVFAACLLGAIGACLSTLMDLKSGNQVPNYLDSIMITMVRPVIGFTAALLLFISINAKLLSFEPTLTMYWLLCFVSGFSDRLVLGVVSKFEGSGKKANQ